MKFYVRSGELEKIVTAKDAREACDKAIDLCKGETIDGHYFYVDERGFRGIKMINGVSMLDTDAEEPQYTIETDDVIATFGFDNEEEYD